MRKVVFAATVSVLAMGVSISAQASEDLAKKSGCTACHAIDKKILGPAYKDVAAKYKGDAKAEAMLVEKVKKGGAGNWGQVPMTPHPALSDAEIKTLVKWVLTTK